MKVIIPARGGSKGVPGKNIKKVNGIPLLAYPIISAHMTKGISKVYVSTDDEEIASVAKEYGCAVPFMRPTELATDTAASMDVVLHALETVEESYDYIVLLQPTSPLRTAGPQSPPPPSAHHLMAHH